MKKNFLCLQIIIFVSLTVVPPVAARASEVYRKTIRLELNPVPGASAYELELVSSTNSETYKLETPTWRGDLEPGQYRIRMRSFDKRNIRGEWSDFKSIQVPAAEPPPGQESPAKDLENQLSLRSSLRCEGLCVLFGYRFTSVNYSSTNYDKTQAANSQFSALGATGQIGMIHESNSQWGYEGILNSTFVKTDSSYNPSYILIDASIFRRITIAMDHDFQFQLGLFYKEDPVLTGDATTLLVNNSALVAAVGPWLGIKYKMQIARSCSAWIFAQMHEGTVKIKTPNSQQLNSSRLNQIGVMGSYAMNQSWIVNMGPLISDSNVVYGASAGGAGTTNTVRVQSKSFNVDLEYSF